MTISVYADVLFLINFCMDYMILTICGKMLGIRRKTWRLAVSAAVGGIYSVALFIPDISFMYTSVFKIFVSIGMIAIAFPHKKKKEFFMRVILFYVVNFVFGGACMVLLYFTDIGYKTSALVKNGVFYMQLPLIIVIGGSIVAYICITLISRFIKNRHGRRLYNVTISFGGRNTTATALLDTGNCLTEPVTRKPVVVAQWDVVKQILPAECTRENFVRHVKPEKLRMIPYQSVGEKHGVIWGICVDQIYFEQHHVQKAIVGIYEGKLSDEYSVLLHTGLI